MRLLTRGKTKDVYDVGDGTYLLRFKDDVTVDADGNIDPGGNAVGASIAGLGRASLRLTKYFFEKINGAGIYTHYIGCDLGAGEMTVRPAIPFGGAGIEVICRLKAAGSFTRRYGAYCAQGQDLDFFTEISLKDNGRGDPFIGRDALKLLHILTPAEYDDLAERARKITAIVRDDLTARGLTLYDIKLEFGRIGDEIALIDEFSWGVMRVYRDGAWLEPLELAEYFQT